jgi:hypothetical protein
MRRSLSPKTVAAETWSSLPGEQSLMAAETRAGSPVRKPPGCCHKLPHPKPKNNRRRFSSTVPDKNFLF